MNDFRFANSGAFWLLLLAPLALAAAAWGAKRAQERLKRFASEMMLPRLLPQGGPKGVDLPAVLFACAMFCLVLALARPQGNPRVEEHEAQSLDIMVLLDISRSMDAEDAAPSRLKKAKHTISTLLDQLQGDRVGIVAFAGSAVLLAPLTSDYELIRSFLQNADSSLIENQGTNFTAAFQVAMKAFLRGSASQPTNETLTHLMVILSDGEETKGSALEAAKHLKEGGVTVFAIALGTEKGVPIPLRNERGDLAGYKKDSKGETVISAVNGKALKQLAEVGGGAFYFSTADESEVRDIIGRTKDLQRRAEKNVKAKVYEEYFYLPLICGALFLFASLFLGFPLRQFIPARMLPIITLALLGTTASAAPLDFLRDREAVLSAEAERQLAAGKAAAAVEAYKSMQAECPESPAIQYNLGTALAQAGDAAGAEKILKEAEKQGGDWAALSRFNQAGAQGKAQKRADALASTAALVRDLERQPQRTAVQNKVLTDARRNLELLAQQNKDQQNKPQDSKDKKDDQSQDQKDKQDKKDSGKNDDKKEEKQPDQGDKGDKNEQKPDPDKDQQGNQLPPRKRPFQDRKDMTEAEAKQILEALKEQEAQTQKKFLKKQEKDSKFKLDDTADKDW